MFAKLYLAFTCFVGVILLSHPAYCRSTRSRRAYVIDFEHSKRGTKWDGHEIQYTLSANLFQNETAAIRNALNMIEKSTCLRFKETSSADENVIIYMRTEYDRCMSNVGKQFNRPNLIIGNWRCFSKPGYIIHETMHSLGFLHEHQRPDRDSYVDILWKNVREEKKRNFEKLDYENRRVIGRYDYLSVMHYEPFLFAKEEGEKTILSLHGAFTELMGQKWQLSYGDIDAINQIYCNRY